MWPFKKETNDTTAYQKHLEKLRGWFGPHLSEEELLNPAKTADGHRLDTFFICHECGILVHREKAKPVEHLFHTIYRREKRTIHYCQTHAPAWDVVKYPYYPGDPCTHYRQVAEYLEEVPSATLR